MSQGTIPLQTMVRGNTLLARNFTYTVNAAPASITSARFSVRRASKQRVHYAECSVAGSVVTRPEVPASITAGWPEETLNWDMEITLAGGVERTWIRGQIRVLPTEQ